MKIHYLSDFDFLISLLDCNGDAVGFPPDGVDWDITLQTQGSPHSFSASCTGGVCLNCFNDNGRIHIVVKNHNLPPGQLVATMTVLSPNKIYPTGTKCIVDRQILPIELVAERNDCSDSSFSLDITAPEIGYTYLRSEIDLLNTRLTEIQTTLTQISNYLRSSQFLELEAAASPFPPTPLEKIN